MTPALLRANIMSWIMSWPALQTDERSMLSSYNNNRGFAKRVWALKSEISWMTEMRSASRLWWLILDYMEPQESSHVLSAPRPDRSCLIPYGCHMDDRTHHIHTCSQCCCPGAWGLMRVAVAAGMACVDNRGSTVLSWSHIFLLPVRYCGCRTG